MIKILKRKKIEDNEKVCPIGDILYGEEYFIKPYDVHYGQVKFLPVTAIRYNPWKCLKGLGIDYEEFQKELAYEDFVSDNIYYWAVPVFLFSDKVDEIVDNTKDIYWKDLYKDHDWQARSYFREFEDDDNPWKHEFVMPSISESLMGHGYTFGTIPSDGHGGKKNAIVELSDGSFLGCKVWVWYNK